MTKPFDAVDKDMIEAAPAGWAAVFGQPRPADKVRVIDADLSATVTTAADKVICIEDPEAWLILASYTATAIPTCL